MDKIGLVGGLTWLSTLEYYRLINLSVSQKLGRNHSAPLLIESIDRQGFLDAVERDPTEREAAKLIVNAFRVLQLGGARVFAVCANGIHRFEATIYAETGIEILSIATATAKRAATLDIKTVGLLGVQKTMEGAFFPNALNSEGIEVLIPPEDQQRLVHAVIVDELVHGVIAESTRRELERVSLDLHNRGAQAIIMGCTEIPLAFPNEQIAGIPALSTTQIHCEFIVDAAS